MKIAVVTGEHGFQEKQFDAVFESMEGIQFVREDLDDFVEDPKPEKLRHCCLLQLPPSLSNGCTSTRNPRSDRAWTRNGHLASRHPRLSRMGYLFRNVRNSG